MNVRASAVLRTSGVIWFLTAVAGQWIFAAYIVAFHGRAILSGDWTKPNQLLPQGYMAGNSIGNSILAGHLLLAAWILVAGTLQLMPQIRTRFPVFHRWNGRAYISVAFLMGASGLYLILSGRKLVGDDSQTIAIGINAILILAFAALAWRTAVARDFQGHQRWAMRLFLTVSGVWFFRVGLMCWLLLNRAPVGFDTKTFTGPFLTALAFGQYLLPLAVLELYWYARDHGTPSLRLATAVSLLGLTLLMAAGIFGATMGMWLPRL